MEGVGLHGLCVTLWLKWAPDPWAGIAPTNRTSSGPPFWLQFAMINFMCAAKAVAGELESVISSVSPASFAPKHPLNQRQLRTLGANALSS